MSSRSSLQRLRYYTEYPRDLADVPTLADQIAIADAIRRHDQAEAAMTLKERAERKNCRVWKAGVGMVRDGVWDESPALTLERLGRKR